MKLMLERDSGSGKKRVGGREKQTTWKGKNPMNNLKRKHELKSLRKERKDFTRVGWILDYGLWLREEKGVGGWEKKTTEGRETTSLRVN